MTPKIPAFPFGQELPFLILRYKVWVIEVRKKGRNLCLGGPSSGAGFGPGPGPGPGLGGPGIGGYTY